MKLIVVIIGLCFNLLMSVESQVRKSKDCLPIDQYNNEKRKWVCNRISLDTLYNPNFKPNPILYQSSIYNEIDDDLYDLEICLSKLLVDSIKLKIYLEGVVKGGWHGGSGSEVLVMVATRIDTVSKYYNLHSGYEGLVPINETKSVKFFDYDYHYTNYSLKKKKEFRLLKCTLEYSKESNVLFFGLNSCYAKLYDLKRIINDYGKVSIAPTGADL